MRRGSPYSLILLFLFLSLLLSSSNGGTEESVVLSTYSEEDPQNRPDNEALPVLSTTVNNQEWVKEQTGQYIPLDAWFKNEKGETVTLRQLVDRPTLLLPVYYYCPKICSFDMANLAVALSQTSHPFDNFNVITMSFSEAEPPEAAAMTKTNFIELLGERFPDKTWTFLTGDIENIMKVTEAIGYTFKKQPDQTFIHASAMVALADDGQIIKYIYGNFIAGDVDLAIAEAGKGSPATSIKRFLSFCFNYNPQQNQGVFRILKFGTIALVGFGGLFFLLFLFKKRD